MKYFEYYLCPGADNNPLEMYFCPDAILQNSQDKRILLAFTDWKREEFIQDMSLHVDLLSEESVALLILKKYYFVRALELSTSIPDIPWGPSQKKRFHVSHTANSKITTCQTELKHKHFT